jgi:hypothetical protein
MNEEIIKELIRAVEILVLDTTAMQSRNDPDWFGDFSIWEENPNGAMIEWPNLAIDLEALRKILRRMDP